MKSYNHLYEKMISKENIILAIRNAAKGKHDRPVVQAVLRDVETHATRVVELIESGEIKPQKHKGRIMYDSRRASHIFYETRPENIATSKSFSMPLCKCFLRLSCVVSIVIPTARFPGADATMENKRWRGISGNIARRFGMF